MSVLSDVRSLPANRYGSGILDWIQTTDHKRIGILYITTAFAFFFVGGLLAEIMRTELIGPDVQLVSENTYNSLFTMHGTIMLLLFATPMAIGLANFVVPLQIGAADMAFPRLNALSYWLFLFGSLIVLSSFLTAGGAPAIGWYAYAPLTEPPYSSGPGVDLWSIGLVVSGLASVLGSVNFVATIYSRRAPGMTMFRMPIFTWNILVTAILIMFAFPPLTAALIMLFIDRNFGGAFFDVARGGSAVLWQNIFWFFGHPEVYILILPFFGVITEIIPVFSRKPVFGYRSFVLATVTIASLSMAVWAHHMFTTGAVNLPFFSIVSLLIAVPTGIKFFNWTATMWRGHLSFPTPMLWAMGFLYLFLIGGVTGVMLASPPLDFHFEDTYFVVAHFHATLVGGTVFAVFAGTYFWFPKMTGRRLDERLGKLHFWSWFVGFILTFAPQFQLGLEGMPRRIAHYTASPAWQPLNDLSTVGAYLLAVGILPFVLAVLKALRSPADQPDDPWGGYSLEWATASPPPHHNFHHLPPIRSERPAFDARMAAAGLDPRRPVLGGPAGSDGGATPDGTLP